MSEVTVKYSDIDISYNEGDDKWEFELRGRSRSADTLAKAKEAIDKSPIDKVDAKAFNRIPAYRANSWGTTAEFSKVEITSIAESGWRDSLEFWTVRDGKREKTGQDKLFVISPENDALIAELKRLEKEKDALDNLRAIAFKKLIHVQP